ncbi:hypothetical protein V7S43_004568 [Phytophthora oleae]|uniref:Origin recognition complex subunit 1 n=1 Tax=Phytophthora oleae TaxID=2107226 RepID=A0ABD3FWY2_9STRA
MSQEQPPNKKQKTQMAAEESEATLELGADEYPYSSTVELPPLPFVDKYRIGKYYCNRPCYDEYYKLVKAMLDNQERCVTVTGTPGIGKYKAFVSI